MTAYQLAGLYIPSTSALTAQVLLQRMEGDFPVCSLMVGFPLTLKMRKILSIGNGSKGTAEHAPVVLQQNQLQKDVETPGNHEAKP